MLHYRWTTMVVLLAFTRLICVDGSTGKADDRGCEEAWICLGQNGKFGIAFRIALIIIISVGLLVLAAWAAPCHMPYWDGPEFVDLTEDRTKHPEGEALCAAMTIMMCLGVICALIQALQDNTWESRKNNIRSGNASCSDKCSYKLVNSSRLLGDIFCGAALGLGIWSTYNTLDEQCNRMLDEIGHKGESGIASVLENKDKFGVTIDNQLVDSQGEEQLVRVDTDDARVIAAFNNVGAGDKLQDLRSLTDEERASLKERRWIVTDNWERFTELHGLLIFLCVMAGILGITFLATMFSVCLYDEGKVPCLFCNNCCFRGTKRKKHCCRL